MLHYFSGLPQTAEMREIDGNKCLYVETLESGSDKRRGFVLAQGVKIDGDAAIEVMVRPMGNLDGIAEIYLIGDNGRQISFRMRAGCFGGERELIVNALGRQHVTPSKRQFAFDKWYYVNFIIKSDQVLMALLDSERRVIWKYTFANTNTEGFGAFDVVFAQELGQPGGGEWLMKAYIGYVKAMAATDADFGDIVRIPTKTEIYAEKWKETTAMMEEYSKNYKPQGPKAITDIDLRTLVPAVNDTAGLDGMGEGTQRYWFEGDELSVTTEGDMDCLQTRELFTMPLRVDMTCKTDGSDVRLYFHQGEILFNMGDNPSDMEFHTHDILTGQWWHHRNVPNLPANEYVDISWVIEKKFMEVYVNGELWFRKDNYPYNGFVLISDRLSRVKAPVRFSTACGSVVTVKSLKVIDMGRLRQHERDEKGRATLAVLEAAPPRGEMVETDLSAMTAKGDIEHYMEGNCLVMTAQGDNGRLVTPQKFTDSVKIELRAKTDSTNIRVRYGKGQIILNWECNMAELRVHDVKNWNQAKGYKGCGAIPVDEFVDIEWVIGREVMAVKVNGELRHAGCEYDYIKAYREDGEYGISSTVSVEAAWGSTVVVERLCITEI
jgi:hypothetical protein